MATPNNNQNQMTYEKAIALRKSGKPLSKKQIWEITMKQIITTTLLLLCMAGAVAQNTPRDYKASLNYNASSASFAVSPSGEIWMSDYYDVWHTNGISDSWKRVSHPYSYAVDFSYVVCPDTNTVLIFGRLFDPSDTSSRYNQYLRSTDGGKTWIYLSIPYRMKRDNIWVVGRNNGQVWLRVDSIMYYSSDKGLHFQEMARIPDCKFRFDMDDNGRDGMGRLNWKDSEGISRESLVMTRDNWAHYEKIPTPYDQHPEIKTKYFFYSFAICHSKMVMEQADRYFWTSIDTICWREIPLNIRDFAVDRENNEWVFVTRENLLLRSVDLRTFDTMNTHGLCYFTEIKHVDNHSVYGFSYNYNLKDARQERIDSLYRISADGLTACGLYTDELPLNPNRYIHDKNGDIKLEVESDEIRVALDSRHDLILFDQHNQKWYRHLKTTFPIEEVQIGTNELKGNLLLSDGARQYLAKIDTPVITPYRIEHPLDEFLKSPVESVDIVYKFFPCDGQRFSERVLYRLEGNDFVIKKLSLWKKRAEFTHTFTDKQLRNKLKALNTGYDASVRVADLGFTQEDYDSLRRFVFPYARRMVDFSTWCDSATKERVLDILPQLGDSIWTEIIQSYLDGTCTSSSTFEITFQNKAGQTLVVSHEDNSCNYGYYPYKTPFQVQCHGCEFPATSLPFMCFVGEITPTSMQDRSFSKFSLLMKAYRYVIMHREAFGI